MEENVWLEKIKDYSTPTLQSTINVYEAIIDNQQKQIDRLSEQIKKLSEERASKVSVLRCPSCYAPIGSSTKNYCEYCGSFLKYS